MKWLLYILFSFVLGVSLTVCCCQRDTTSYPMLVDVDSALKLSGDNRGELEKVLDYYRTEKPDPLKLKAAEYLISNMVAHYSVGGKTMERLKRDIDTTFHDKPQALKLIFYLVATRIATTQGDNTVEYDLHHITSDYLIKNIERSFVIWEDIKNYYDLSSDDFFKYVLPYRINNEPLTWWKDNSDQLSNLYKDEQWGFNLSGYQSYVMANVDSYYSYNKLINQLSDSLFKKYTWDCIDRAYNTQIINRLLGIPTAVDFVPHFPTQENRHYWAIVKDQCYVNSRSFNSYNTPYTAKVYRKTSFINEIPEDKNNFIPYFIRDPYKMDVTGEYENVTRLEYTFNTIQSGTKYGYLCVFNNLDWNEVGWSEIRGGKVVFDNIGRDIMYMPCYYNGNKRVLADYPLWIKSNGEVMSLVPDKDSLQTLRLKRKFSYNASGDYKGQAIMGVQIHATNDLKKEPYDSISVIRHYNYMAYDTLRVNTTKKYKYWMIKKVLYSYPEFASVKFVKDGADLTATSTFTIDAAGKMDKDGLLSQYIFNDDLLSFATLGKIAGVEFEEPVSVDVVKYISRNDKNGIYAGNNYELFYFDKGKWVSLGRKVATADYMEYDNVPSGALYWLRNRTEGKEERPFTVVNGRVRFW